MKNILPLIIVFFLITLVQSCQKDFVDTDSSAVPPVAAHNDSVTLLSKVVLLNPITSDTDWINEVVYDSLRRVRYGKGYDYSSGNIELFSIATYYYHGTETLPFKQVIEELGNPDIDTNFYFYDNLHRLVKTAFNSLRSVEYMYTDSTIIAVRYNNSNPSVRSYGDTGFIGNTGNIIKTVSNNIGLQNPVTTYFAYDNHPNPFTLLNIYSTFDPIPDESFFPEDGYQQKHNAISSTIKGLLTPEHVTDITFTYTYNAAGFPETEKSSRDNGQTFDDKVVFVYKRI